MMRITAGAAHFERLRFRPAVDIETLPTHIEQ
jgi:hypothetical protein